MSYAQAWLDGVEVTNVAIEGSSTRRLNRPSQAQISIPMDQAIGGTGSRLKVAFDGTLHHHGTVLLCEASADENTGTVVYNSTDPLELWHWRPVRDGDGDLSKPSLIDDFVTGPQIINEMINNSITNTGPADEQEGPLFLSLGSFEFGGLDLTGAPTDWPMTMAELASLFTSTGEVDIVLTPIDSGDNMAEINVYNGNYGSDLTGSVIFQYGLGARNVRALRWNSDMTQMCNKLRYYLGTKIDEQHWPAEINGNDPGNWGSYPKYGAAVAARDASQPVYGTRMDIKIYDALGTEVEMVNSHTQPTALFKSLWITEQFFRSNPIQMYHITPIRNAEIGAFDIGDVVTVQAAAAILGGFSGESRVYEYTISWDQESVPALSELQTSPSQEGI